MNWIQKTHDSFALVVQAERDIYDSSYRTCPWCGQQQFWNAELLPQCPSCGRQTDDLKNTYELLNR